MNNALVLDETSLKNFLNELLSNILISNQNKQAQQVADEPSLLTIDEVANLLKCHRQSVYNWKKAGLIPFRQIGRRVYFDKSDVMQSLKNLRNVTV